MRKADRDRQKEIEKTWHTYRDRETEKKRDGERKRDRVRDI